MFAPELLLALRKPLALAKTGHPEESHAKKNTLGVPEAGVMFNHYQL